MCGIAGAFSLTGQPIPLLRESLQLMNRLQAHRGPDDEGIWHTEDCRMGLAHRRLSIIDLSKNAHQPMVGKNGTILSYNGEIYNYQELRQSLYNYWPFTTHSDSEAILAAYSRYATECLSHLRGMFAFAIANPEDNSLFCARDRFGVKPFYYTIVGDVFYFASEAKALLPFLPQIETNEHCFTEYLMFQYTIGEEILFKGIKKLLPGHYLTIQNGTVHVDRYWDVTYKIDQEHDEKYYEERLVELFRDSVKFHLRSDVPVASYLSGGVDSSLITLLAQQETKENFYGSFHGKFTDYPGYDESSYAEIVSKKAGTPLFTATMNSHDFANSIKDIIYYLDWPIAGPGAFPQYMVSKLASQHVKVVLGGQGGDEIFGGYARYTLAYFEQCIKAAIEGTHKNGHFVVTPESIIPNLGILREYKPLIKEFWREGLFDEMDNRYLRLCDRSTDVKDEVIWEELDKSVIINRFRSIFNDTRNTGSQAYFDKMTHYDFKCQLPALLHVEDRVSMAHGIEARVPFLDHALVEFAATIPANVKFNGGRMKHLLKQAFSDIIPGEILNRRDKMGFPVPLNEWFQSDLKEFVMDTLQSKHAQERPHIRTNAIVTNLEKTGKFSRKMWGFLSMELWYQNFHDQQHHYHNMLEKEVACKDVVQ